MSKRIIAVLAVLAVASTTYADYFSLTDPSTPEKVFNTTGGTLPAADPREVGIPIPVDISGTPSQGMFGDPANALVPVVVGAGTIINGIGWDTTQTAFDPSLLSEMVFGIDLDNDGLAENPGLFITPGFGVAVSGTESFSSQGIIKLEDAGLSNLVAVTDTINLVFFENFDDGL